MDFCKEAYNTTYWWVLFYQDWVRPWGSDLKHDGQGNQLLIGRRYPTATEIYHACFSKHFLIVSQKDFSQVMGDREIHSFQRHIHLHIFTLSQTCSQSHTSRNTQDICLLAGESRLTWSQLQKSIWHKSEAPKPHWELCAPKGLCF